MRCLFSPVRVDGYALFIPTDDMSVPGGGVRPRDGAGWVEVVAVSQGHLSCGFFHGHLSSCCAQARTYNHPDALLRAIKRGNGFEQSLHSQVDVVCGVDGHGHAHSGRVCHIRVPGVTRFHDKTGANGLFTCVVAYDMRLHPLLELRAKKAGNGQINAPVHEPEGISRADHAVKSWNLLKSAMEDFDCRIRCESLSPSATQRGIGISQNELLHRGESWAVQSTMAQTYLLLVLRAQ